jgi:hypothetical protein
MRPPVVAFKQYTLSSPLPTYKRPPTTVGDEYTIPLMLRDHVSPVDCTGVVVVVPVWLSESWNMGHSSPVGLLLIGAVAEGVITGEACWSDRFELCVAKTEIDAVASTQSTTMMLKPAMVERRDVFPFFMFRSIILFHCKKFTISALHSIDKSFENMV